MQTDFTERILDVVTDARNGTTVEFPDLHDKAFEIPDPANENLILAQKLKTRGFVVTDSATGIQGLTGTRSITQRLSKDGCDCEVTKTYWRTEYVSQYRVTENIKCD